MTILRSEFHMHWKRQKRYPHENQLAQADLIRSTPKDVENAFYNETSIDTVSPPTALSVPLDGVEMNSKQYRVLTIIKKQIRTPMFDSLSFSHRHGGPAENFACVPLVWHRHYGVPARTLHFPRW